MDRVQSVDARYHEGVLEPEQPLNLREGERVHVTVESVENGEPAPDRILALARAVYTGLSEPEILNLERVILDRSRFSLGRP